MKVFLRRIREMFSFMLQNSKPKPILIKSTNKIKSLGRESYHNGNFNVKGSGKLEIGSFCAIGEDVTVILSNHDYSRISMQYTFYKKFLNEDIVGSKLIITKIGNDVWIGDKAVILPGKSIGTGAVIGAGAIVSKDVAPYTIVGGNPAKVIKKRFDDDKIEKLLKSEWWNWEDKKIQMNKDFFI